MVTEARQATLDELIAATEPLVEVSGEPGMAKEKRFKDTWGEVISYLDGQAFGIAPDGRTVGMGAEAKVKEAIADAKIKVSNPVIQDIIETERQLKNEGELENGRSQGINAKRTTRKPIIGSNKRIRPGRLVGVKQLNNRRLTPGKRPTIPGAKPK